MDPDFERITEALGVNEKEREVAEALWLALIDAHDSDAGDSWRTAVAIEEAVVWRVLVLRMLCDLGTRGLFMARDQGNNKGTVAAHPAIEGLAKTYERLQKRMKDTMATFGDDQEGPAGLPDVAKEILEKTEGVLEEALEVVSDEKAAEQPGPYRPTD